MQKIGKTIVTDLIKELISCLKAAYQVNWLLLVTTPTIAKKLGTR
ncbi:hypothetical protein ACQ86K_26350 [Mucilaginibacter sp. P19]